MVLPVWAALTAALAPPIINAHTASRSRSTTSKTEVDIGQIVRSAKEAGINPLTALRYTGGGAGTTTSTELPGLASERYLGEAISNGLQAWYNQPQLQADAERQQIELDIAKRQLELLNREAAGPFQPFGFTVPQNASYGEFQGPASLTNPSALSDKSLPDNATIRQVIAGADGTETKYVPTEQSTILKDFRGFGGIDYSFLNVDEVGEEPWSQVWNLAGHGLAYTAGASYKGVKYAADNLYPENYVPGNQPGFLGGRPSGGIRLGRYLFSRGRGASQPLANPRSWSRAYDYKVHSRHARGSPGPY